MRRAFYTSRRLQGKFLKADEIFASRISKSGKSRPSIDCDVISPSANLVTSTSWVHNIAIVGHLDLEHTSVLKLVFQQWTSSGVREFFEMQVRDLIPRIFHHTILKISSSCTISTIPGRKLPGKAWSWYRMSVQFFSRSFSLFRNFACTQQPQSSLNCRRMLLEVHLEQVDLQKRVLFRASGCKQERLLIYSSETRSTHGLTGNVG